MTLDQVKNIRQKYAMAPKHLLRTAPMRRDILLVTEALLKLLDKDFSTENTVIQDTNEKSPEEEILALIEAFPEKKEFKIPVSLFKNIKIQDLERHSRYMCFEEYANTNHFPLHDYSLKRFLTTHDQTLTFYGATGPVFLTCESLRDTHG